MRKKIVAGNWKMNMDLEEGLKLARAIRDHFEGKTKSDSEAIICSPYIHLSSLNNILSGSGISFGAQNCSAEPSGAFTGEISCSMIKSTGAEFVIIGHSERRTFYNENDLLLNKKTAAAISKGLKVIFCCGEVLAERESGKFFEVVKRQLETGLFTLSEHDLKSVVIAYEPVWAIGTGLTATPEQAQEMHKYIRDLLAAKYGSEVADRTLILYGGSCKASNAAELFSMPDVDGGLIGGAALKSEEFCAIIEAANQVRRLN
jgi:triosephosphate isomerase